MSLKDFFLLSERGKDCHSFVIDFDCIDYSDEWCAKGEFRKKILVQNDSLVQEFEHFQRSFEDREIVDPNGNERKINRQFYSEKKSLRDQQSNTDKRLSDSDIDSSFERSF